MRRRRKPVSDKHWDALIGKGVAHILQGLSVRTEHIKVEDSKGALKLLPPTFGVIFFLK